MRRQNHSCDQCRKSKRACDAPPLENARRGSQSSQHGTRDLGNGALFRGEAIGPSQRVRPCSYCLRTNKHCTLFWARSQSSDDDQSRKHRRKEQRKASQSSTLDYGAAGQFDNSKPLSQYEDLDWDSIISSLDPNPLLIGSSQSPKPSRAGTLGNTPSQIGLQDILDDLPGNSESSYWDADSIFATLDEINIQPDALKDPYYSIPTLQDYSNPGDFVVSSHHVQDATDTAPQTSARFQPTADWLQRLYIPLSPSSVEHTMISRTDNTFISQNLLRVYHDVFEHSLSCWVSEETCPYKMPFRSRSGSRRMIPSSRSVNLEDGSRPAQGEWGSTWSNRIYSRVVKLDRAAQSSNIIRLTRAEDQAVTKALHLAIMAFASQWAHQSRRELERFPSGLVPETQGLDNPDDLGEEFDRLIQRSFWEQARKALNACAELECYRVICAELIFGLTQRPWERECPDSVSVGFEFEHGVPGMNTSTADRIQCIISRDGPPLFMERATRKVYALKFRLDAIDAGLIKANKGFGYLSEAELAKTIGTGDRETIGFVYWLAVMFDTISASIHQRPVVVTDEDCQHDDVREIVLAEPECGEGSNTLSVQKWSINHFIQDNPNNPVRPLRWPCSYEAASRAVTRSGPVKILLYRHVSYLQDAIRKGQRGEPVEDIIRNAVLVYCYWNVTYGVFFRDLIEKYVTVPARIQSWFFCILAHWHLAALILADLIESIDDNNLGNYQSSRERLGAATVDTIRRASARELSDLARITTPPDSGKHVNPSSPQLPEFHSAVNQGAILTEPWTMILIRAFSKAFIWHMGRAELWQGNRALLVPHDRQEASTQCAEYVKALWYLGKKSDMARNVAEALSTALLGMQIGHV